MCSYLLQPARADETATKTEAARTPMAIYCVDVSASMSGSVGRAGATRLSCVKSAVVAHLRELAKSDPTCIPAIVTFSNSVRVLADGRAIEVETALHENPEGLMARGAALRSKCTETARASLQVGICSSVVCCLFVFALTSISSLFRTEQKM